VQEVHSAAVDPIDRPLDEPSAFAWARHYAVLLVAALVVGAVVGGTIAGLRPPSAEAWTYVLQTPYRLPRAQLGVMSKAIFASPVVLERVRAELGVAVSETAFRQSVEVRPVPQSSTLIVAAHSADGTYSRELSAAAASGLVEAFRRIGVPEFEILGTGPPAVASSVSDKVVIVAAMVVALLAGVVVALVHFGVVRPILSLDRAIAVTGPSRLVELRRTRLVRVRIGRERPDPLVVAEIPMGVPVLAGGGRSVRPTAERLASSASRGERRDGRAAVVVAGPSTKESFLLGAGLAVEPGADLTLVWLG
jgi:hypothetical protein